MFRPLMVVSDTLAFHLANARAEQAPAGTEVWYDDD